MSTGHPEEPHMGPSLINLIHAGARHEDRARTDRHTCRRVPVTRHAYTIPVVREIPPAADNATDDTTW
jgi:hypothetical protein